MDSEYLTLAAFVIITTFTPGPNNISSASMGILYGYKKTLRYLLGIFSGFFLLLVISGFASTILLEKIPSLERGLRIVGALYILWLAWQTLHATYTFNDSKKPLLGFLKGLLLQILNPKVIIFGLTLYGTFLADKNLSQLYILLSAVICAGIGFASISIWTLFGAVIRRYLNQPRIQKIFNYILAIMLVYTAIDISGILTYLY